MEKLGRVSLRRVRLNGAGYDASGSYWGIGRPLYCAMSDCGTVDLWFRASDRPAAKLHVLEKHPGVRFYGGGA